MIRCKKRRVVPKNPRLVTKFLLHKYDFREEETTRRFLYSRSDDLSPSLWPISSLVLKFIYNHDQDSIRVTNHQYQSTGGLCNMMPRISCGIVSLFKLLPVIKFWFLKSTHKNNLKNISIRISYNKTFGKKLQSSEEKSLLNDDYRWENPSRKTIHFQT